MKPDDDAITTDFPGPVRSGGMRGVALLGIIVPLVALLPVWWGRPSLDALTLLSFLACAAAPLPFGAWIGEAFGDAPRAQRIMLRGLIVALLATAAGYAALIATGYAAAKPPEAMLVVPLAQLVFVLLTAFTAWTFGRY